MEASAAQTRLTPEEYITFEREALPEEYITFEREALPGAEIIRHEYINGELIAMSGASRAHNLITRNIFGELRTLFRGSRCETYANEMRVSTPMTTSYFYPDIVVVCEELIFEDDLLDTLLNPMILVEVFSPSTQVYDRREKFAHYRQLASLQEYILVSEDKVLVEHYCRHEKQGTAEDWLFTDFQALEESLPLTSIQCELPLQEIYEHVTFPD